MTIDQIKKAVNLYFDLYFDKNINNNVRPRDKVNWVEQAIWWFEHKYDLSSLIDYEDDVNDKENLHDKHIKLFVKYAMERENILYELYHSWDDAVEEFYAILDHNLPDIIERLEKVKERLIAGNNKNIWDDGKKIKNYYNSERICNRATKIDKILKDLNNAKDHLYDFQKIL